MVDACYHTRGVNRTKCELLNVAVQQTRTGGGDNVQESESMGGAIMLGTRRAAQRYIIAQGHIRNVLRLRD